MITHTSRYHTALTFVNVRIDSNVKTTVSLAIKMKLGIMDPANEQYYTISLAK